MKDNEKDIIRRAIPNDMAMAMLDWMADKEEAEYFPIGWAADRIRELEAELKRHEPVTLLGYGKEETS